jgi:hypothetical protein
VTRDVQYVIDGPDLPTPEVLTAIDRVADQLEPYPGWQIRVVIDPGTVIVATPAPTRAPRPSEAPTRPLSPEGTRTERTSTPPDRPRDPPLHACGDDSNPRHWNLTARQDGTPRIAQPKEAA